MESMMPIIVTAVSTVLASSGLWAYLASKRSNKDNVQRLILGLAHDRIVFLGMSYLERGWISKDEYNDFVGYLYDPYEAFGGNGLAEKVMTDVKQLPIHNHNPNLRKVETHE